MVFCVARALKSSPRAKISPLALGPNTSIWHVDGLVLPYPGMGHRLSVIFLSVRAQLQACA